MSKKRSPKKGDIVLVEWLDSCGPYRKWHDPSILKSMALQRCYTVGRVGRYDEAALILHASWSDDEVGDVAAIPAPCVKNIKVLRKKA